ncbi:MAG TPA: ATP synthase F0 subunit B [Silvibacterium sp.]|nr:ATP synthase F0 subunit B [Silvibacterium sp.]
MNALVLIAAEGGGQVQQIAQTFGVDWPQLIAQIISFSIVCFLLQRFAYKPVLNMLEQRRKQIEEGVANAKKIADELAQAETRRREMLAQTNEQITKLFEEARAAAASVKDEETQKAIASAEQILAKAREAAQQDYTRMLAELKKELGRLVVEATTTVTRKVLTPEDQRRLDEETAAELAA